MDFVFWFLLPLFTIPQSVVLMGDSEAYLLGWEFPALVAETKFETIAVPGSSVIQWSTGLDKQWYKIRKAKPTTIFISLGANDSCINPSIIKNEGPFLDKFIARLRRTGAKRVIWLGPPKIGVGKPGTKSKHPHAMDNQDAFAELIGSRGIEFWDAREIEVEMWDDQLHCSRPNYYRDKAHGCLDWAKWVWNRFSME